MINNKIESYDNFNKRYTIYKDVEEEIQSNIFIPIQPNFNLSIPNWEYLMKSNLKPIKYIINYNKDDRLGLSSTIGQSALYTNKHHIFYLPLTGEKNGTWCKGIIENINYDTINYNDYGNGINAYESEKIYYQDLSCIPIAPCQGAKIHNVYFETNNNLYEDSDDTTIYHPATFDICFNNIIDKNDKVSNIVTQLNITENGLLTITLDAATLNAFGVYKIPFSLKSKNQNYVIDSYVNLNLIARYLIEPDNLEGGIIVNDNTSYRDYLLPWFVNPSSADYAKNQNITVEDLSFVVNEPTIGSIIVNPNNIPTENNKIRFVPNLIYAGNVDYNTVGKDTSKTEIVHYKIVYTNTDGVVQEFTEYNNMIGITVNNTYSDPYISKKFVTLNVASQDYFSLDLNTLIVNDELFTNIDVFKIIGPFNGTYNIVEEIINGVQVRELRYTPDPGYNGVDFIFFAVRSKDMPDEINQEIPDNIGPDSADAYLKINVINVEEYIPSDDEEEINIVCLTMDTEVNIVNSDGNKYVFNGLDYYDTATKFGLYNGKYIGKKCT